MGRAGKWVVGTLALAALVGTGACERGDQETSTRTEGTAAPSPGGDTAGVASTPTGDATAPGLETRAEGTGGSGMTSDAGVMQPGMVGRDGGVGREAAPGRMMRMDGGVGPMRLDGGTGGAGMEGTGTGTRDLESGDMGATDLDETEPSEGPGSRGLDAPGGTPPPSG